MRHPEEFTDTDPKAKDVWLDLQRRMPAGEKLGAVFNAVPFLLQLYEMGVRRLYPNATNRELRLRVAARHLPRELVMRADGWDPEGDAQPVGRRRARAGRARPNGDSLLDRGIRCKLGSFARRRYKQSRSFSPEPIECAVASPEDTILRKLEWYRKGGETSERQWNDLLNAWEARRAACFRRGELR